MHVPNQAANRPYGLAKPAIKSLITAERAQKFELLIHLIINFNRPLIVNGPTGIGKSTLLTVLREQRPVEGHYCFMAGDHQLNFAEIQERLRRFLEIEQPACKGFSLDDAIALLEQKKLKLILMIDNAGELIPGLIDALSEYALANPTLRVIFSLTQDELYIKSRSDRSVEDCHFIELLPLSEKQCRDFLQNLSGKPDAPISFNAVSDNMVEYVYRETHGIPGKIIAELPRLSDFERLGAPVRFSIGLFALFAIAGIALVGWEALVPESDHHLTESLPRPQQQALSVPLPVEKFAGKQAVNNSIVTDVAEQQPKPKMTNVVTAPVAALPDRKIETTVKNKKINDLEVVSDSAENDKLENPIADPSIVKAEPLVSAVADEKIETKPQETIDSNRSEDDDRSWLFKQSSDHFTLQLMVLSSRQSIVNVLNKYRHLKQDLKYLETRIGGKEKFILLYGSFSSHADAKRAAGKLPAEFKGAWVRRFAVLQNDTKNAN
ncbi:SPOR domain-containing protein [Methylotuvimicrobium sp. KM2]|uniref:SPOR domain-containing protein n=1 Tax=Methylotuvimicrobium sp. KM2 TaxID=3133976 RepID=UPI00310165E0